MSVLKDIVYRTSIIVLAIPLALGVVWLFFRLAFGSPPNCGASSEAVVYARSLSVARLVRLSNDMQTYAMKNRGTSERYRLYDESAYVPDEFRDLKFHSVRPNDANIMVAGCFDEYAYLEFTGEAWGDTKTTIKLTYPDNSISPYGNGVEILWSK